MLIVPIKSCCYNTKNNSCWYWTYSIGHTHGSLCTRTLVRYCISFPIVVVVCAVVQTQNTGYSIDISVFDTQKCLSDSWSIISSFTCCAIGTCVVLWVVIFCRYFPGTFCGQSSSVFPHYVCCSVSVHACVRCVWPQLAHTWSVNCVGSTHIHIFETTRYVVGLCVSTGPISWRIGPINCGSECAAEIIIQIFNNPLLK